MLSAAVIGSMVPDFGWLTPWHPARFETHSAISLLTFSLPVGLATFWIFQIFVKGPVLEVLPDAAHARARAFAAPPNFHDPLQWILAALGVLLGAITHLVWDAFTHEGARGMRMIPALDDPAVALGVHHLAGARLMQDVSSVVGLIAVLAFCAYELRPDRSSRTASLPRRLGPTEQRLWALLYVAAAVALSTSFFLMHHPQTTRGLQIPLGRAAIAILRGMAIALLSVSLVLRARLRRAEPRPRRVPHP